MSARRRETPIQDALGVAWVWMELGLGAIAVIALVVGIIGGLIK